LNFKIIRLTNVVFDLDPWRSIYVE